MENNWEAKIYRQFSAFFPVSRKRKGKCAGCGECCKLPTKCPFLRYNKDGKSHCIAYSVRSLSCRKYPRTEKEFITKQTCGFRFKR